MDEQISFEIKSDALAVIQTLDIEANFEEMRAYLTEMLAPYKSLVATDMGAAKSARAYVNKVKKSINDSRLMVKKLYTEPLAAFEDKCKALTAICDEASGAIDTQIKAEEQKEKELRINALRAFFDSSAHEIEAYITFERIYNPKWETKSYGMEKAEQDICAALDRTRADVEAIRAMNSPFESALLAEYAQSGDLSRVLIMKANADRVEANKKNQQQDNKKIGAESPEAPEPMQGYTQEPETRTEAQEAHTERMYTFTLEFTATREQAFMINDFFKRNNIRYRKVEGTK